MFFRSYAFFVVVLIAFIAFIVMGESNSIKFFTSAVQSINWLVTLPLAFVVITVIGIHIREARRIKSHRETITHPEKDHSTRCYKEAYTVPVSAILPLTTASTLNSNSRTENAVLKWTTNLTSSLRVITYAPTILTLFASADSTQYNLLSWSTWVIANASLTASLYDQNGRKFDYMIQINCCNTFMSLVTAAVIFYLR